MVLQELSMMGWGFAYALDRWSNHLQVRDEIRKGRIRARKQLEINRLRALNRLGAMPSSIVESAECFMNEN
ncbi:MAG: hypothetical protein ACE5DM_01660 [Candidatus Nanoarchaeia archaeon]